MSAFFHKLTAQIEAQNAFRDYENGEATGDIRRPLYEGAFATSTDASKLFEEGVNVPQEAINLTRLSVSKALEKTMPDWAVQEWLETFLARLDLPQLADTVYNAHKESLAFVPVPHRAPKKFFDYRVDEKNRREDFALSQAGSSVDRFNSVFSKNEILYAGAALAAQPHLVAGVLLWQFALQQYADELADYTLKNSSGAEAFKTRLISFCRFLETSAFMLASFAALLPMAMVVYAKAKNGTEVVKTDDIAPAMEEFSARGGFMKHEKPKTIPYILKTFQRAFDKRGKEKFPPVSPQKIRVTICSAKEALLRWSALPVNNQGALAAYVAMAEKLSCEHEAWNDFCKKIATAMPHNEARCPFKNRRSAG